MDDMNTYGLILESVNEIKDIVTEGEGGQEDMEEKSTLALILDSVNEIKEALGGGGVTVKGLKSISVSPVLATVPALNTVKVNYADIPAEDIDESGEGYVHLDIVGKAEANTDYVFTITPSSEWYADGDDGIGGKGEPVTVTMTSDEYGAIGTASFYLYNYDYTQYGEDEDPPADAEAIILEALISFAGVLSISLTPSIAAVPTFESVMPLLVGTNTNSITMATDEVLEDAAEYTVTVKPASDMYAKIETGSYGGIGETVTGTVTVAHGQLDFNVTASTADDDTGAYVYCQFTIE